MNNEPKRQRLQFGVGTIFWMTLVVAITVYGFNEHRLRMRGDLDSGDPADRTFVNVGGNVGVPLSSINYRAKDKGITFDEAKREIAAEVTASTH